MLTKHWKLICGAAAISLLVACGGGGGGNRAAGVEDEAPPPPGGPVTPPPPVLPTPPGYADAEEIIAFINAADIPADGHTVVDFQVTDGNGAAINDLVVDNVRFVLAKLQASPLGGMTGTWQSYKNVVKSPEVGTGTEDRLQATYERDGEFTNNLDGSYRYRYAIDVNNLDQGVLDQAAAEGLDLSYEADRTHRVAIQFDGGPNPANPYLDWIPATGDPASFRMNIAATATCNRCHDPLGIHGGNRTDIEYCVTCHNPGSTDPDSTNTVDMKVMIHKIHMGANLPSVQSGGSYIIYGFRNSPHDYSKIHYPQDIRNCQNCHVGTGTLGDQGWYDDIQQTSQGDNWAEFPTRAACGSCHDDVDWDTHPRGPHNDDSLCAGCHGSDHPSRSVQETHRMLVREESLKYAAEIVSVINTDPGDFPTVNFRIFNPEDDSDYDLDNDAVWTQAGGASRLAVTLGWSTSEFNNIRPGDTRPPGGIVNASTVSMDALADAQPAGDGSYNITSTVAIPDGGTDPFIAASGSGTSVVEGHPADTIDGNEERVPLRNVHLNYSIDEPDATAEDRREVVTLDQCLSCHETLVLHGNNRTDSVESCVSCHNARNSDRAQREMVPNNPWVPPPTDGKQEESVDFKTMIHAIHAAGMRQDPIQIAGFGGFSVHVFDEDSVHYPGELSNCNACHTDDSYQIPLDSVVLGTTSDTGDDRADPGDDTVTTPTTAVCSSCHDSSLATDHMMREGGSFDTTQAEIDDGTVSEGCDLCHAEGRQSAVSTLHGLD